jgi:hypothetical protein
MGDTTEIEKKSLEAHVELCAERYRFLENKLETVDQKMTALDDMIKKVYDTLNIMADQRNNQLMSWGLGLISLLVGIVGYLLVVYVFPSA